jgi:hypothetical protein
MGSISRFVSAVTMAFMLGSIPTGASAADTCGSMLMPAAQLKQYSRGFTNRHAGVDLTAPYGSPVRAAAGGTVIFAGRYFGYGNMIDIRHADSSVTRYAHLSKFSPGVKPGTDVALGETIGAIGTSGQAHGAHLHFEVRVDGHAIDPAPFLALAQCPTGNTGPLVEEANAPDLSTQLPQRVTPGSH